jgi:hypothetical protein
MMIVEFHSRFSSVDESSLLFAVLRRLSFLDEVACESILGGSWGPWNPVPDPGTDPGAAPVRA